MPFLIVIVTCTIVVQVFCIEDWQTTFYLLLKRSVQLTKWHGHSILLDAECAEGLRSQLLMLTWYVVYCYTLFWILSESGAAYCLSWRYLHWFDIVFIVFDIEQFILSKWWEETAGNSWRRVRVSWSYLMERTYQTVSFGTTRCIGIVRTMVIFEHLICLKIWVMRCFGIVRTIPTSSSSCSLGRCLSSTRTTSLFF